MIPRREFLVSLPPLPGAVKHVLRSPKDSDRANKPMRRPVPTPKVSMKLATAAPGLTVTGIEVENGMVTISWQGGTAPFAVLGAHDVNGPWVQLGDSTMLYSATFPSQDRGFFKIEDNITQVLTATVVDGRGRLEWTVPIIS